MPKATRRNYARKSYWLPDNDEFADDEHGSGVTSAGWDDVQESEISDLEDLDVRRA